MSADKAGNDGPVTGTAPVPSGTVRPEMRVLLDLTYSETELHTLSWILAYAYANWAGLDEPHRLFIDRVQRKIQTTLQQHFPKKKLSVISTE